MLSYYAEMAAAEGLVSMIASNASPWVAPHGATEGRFGTNPICFGFPSADAPVIWDIGTSAIIHAEVTLHRRLGTLLPEGVAFDPAGAPTLDPVAALAGAFAPWGGHKGSGLAMFMDIFGGVISGANFGGEVGDQYKSFDRAQDVGHFFLAMKPDLFVSEDDYRARIDALIDRMKTAPLAEGFSEVLVPGEPEDRYEAERRKRGIPYATSEVKALQDEAKRAGIQPLVLSEQPIEA